MADLKASESLVLDRDRKEIYRSCNRQIETLDPNLPGSQTELRDAEEAGRTIGWQVLIVRAADEREINAAFAKVVQAGAGALLVGSGPVFLGQRQQLVALAARHALPTSYVTRQYPEAGGLMSYGPSQPGLISNPMFAPGGTSSRASSKRFDTTGAV